MLEQPLGGRVRWDSMSQEEAGELDLLIPAEALESRAEMTAEVQADGPGEAGRRLHSPGEAWR